MAALTVTRTLYYEGLHILRPGEITVLFRYASLFPAHSPVAYSNTFLSLIVAFLGVNEVYGCNTLISRQKFYLVSLLAILTRMTRVQILAHLPVRLPTLSLAEIRTARRLFGRRAILRYQFLVRSTIQIFIARAYQPRFSHVRFKNENK